MRQEQQGNKNNKETSSLDYQLKILLQQGWATLFDSQATLVTKLVDAGQYKYNKDLFDICIF